MFLLVKAELDLEHMLSLPHLAPIFLSPVPVLPPLRFVGWGLHHWFCGGGSGLTGFRPSLVGQAPVGACSRLRSWGLTLKTAWHGF